jgi:hypothetical protein
MLTDGHFVVLNLPEQLTRPAPDFRR